MDNFLLIKQADRYFNDEMAQEERVAFEQFCREYPDAAGVVREHYLFLEELDHFVERKDLQNNLNKTYNLLVEKGIIRNKVPSTKVKIVSIFNKYKKVTAIAASIAGFTALLISGFISYINPGDTSKLQQLSRDVEQIKKTQVLQTNKILEVASKVPKGAIVKSGGSAFMVDPKGYLVTNAHVLNGSGVIVANHSGQEFRTEIVYIDQSRDLAILKILDKDFKSRKNLPYALKRGKMDLGQDVFTLGFPRNDIVYNMGYVSAATGFNGDTSTVQLDMMANPGNSGGPVFNNAGNIVGVISTRETKTEGVSFAIKTNEIYQMLDDWAKTDTSLGRLKTREITTSAPKKRSRPELIKELQNYVYLVKVY